MSISINRSSEATTQFNHLTSCLFNISNLEGTPVHSFSSPRHESVTVIGKKIFSNSCLSPEIIEENQKYPIPIKVMSRLKRQSTQAKNLIKQKTLKNLKLKCFEQPSLPAKTSSIANSSVPKIPKPVSKLKKPKKKLVKPEPESIPEKIEKSPKKLNSIIQMSVKSLIKSKKKAERKVKIEIKKKLHNKVRLEEMNSKIRLENSSRFRKEKFKPKVPWGLDERKFSDHKGAFFEIDKQRESRRALKQSPEYKNKRTLGLSKFFEIGEEIGLKRCASTTIKLENSPMASTRKASNPFIKNFIKIKKKKSRELKRNNLIEEVKKETKRIQNLKVLDLVNIEKNIKSKTLKNGRISRKKKKKELNTEDEINKIYNEFSDSGEIIEFDGQAIEIVSKFTEGSVKEAEKDTEKCYIELRVNDIKQEENKLEESDENSEPFELHSLQNFNEVESSKDYSFETQNKAACIIQKFFKSRFSKACLEKEDEDSSYQQEDMEVQEILSAWKDTQQQDSSPKPNSIAIKSASSYPLENLEEMKVSEISEVKNSAIKFSQNPEIVESLTKMIGNRYEHIADLLQNSLNYDNISFPLDRSNSLASYKQELECAKENRGLDFSFPSYKSDKSIEEKVEKVDEIKISEESFQDSEGNAAEESSNGIIVQDFSDSNSATENYLNEKPQIVLISRLSPAGARKTGGDLSKSTVTASDIILLSEFILSAVLLDVIPATNFIQLKSVEKCPKDYIDHLTFNISETNFKYNLKTPLYKDPLEVLSIMHCDEIGYPENFYTELGVPILPNSLFSAVNSQRMRNIADEEIKFFQKTHDKLIFDSCNQMLNHFRTFGINGNPMPWDCSLKQSTIKGGVYEVMPLVANKLEEIDSLDPFSLGIYGEYKIDLNKEYLEAKIKALIVKDIADGEEDWTNYVFEDAQAKINAAEIVLQILIEEIVEIHCGC